MYQYERDFDGVRTVVDESEVPSSQLGPERIITTNDCPSGPWQVIF